MKRSRRVIQLRSYALAFAVALSPVFLQFYSCDRGDTYLLKLELLVDWEDQIQGFNANNRSYAATLYGHTATLTVDTRMDDSTATYQWIVDGTTIEADLIGEGGGSVLVTVPDGQSQLYIGVRAAQGTVEGYTVDVSTCADDDPCPYQGGTGVCFDRACRSPECLSVEPFEGCGAPMTGGSEGACVSSLCVSAAPVDECVKEWIGRINCCSPQGCVNASAAECADPTPMDGISCDPSNIEPPGLPGQLGTCDQGACVANIGSGYGLCEGVRCEPPAGESRCKRNDCEPTTGECTEWAINGGIPCPAYLGGFCSSGLCIIPQGCRQSADCTDTNPCTRDVCNGVTKFCAYVPEAAGTPCELPQSPGQWGFCDDTAVCTPGLIRNDIDMACAENTTYGFQSLWIMPWRLEITPHGDRFPGGVASTMTLGGSAYLSEDYLDLWQTTGAGGIDKVDVQQVQATAVIRSGALGSRTTLLVSDVIPYTCALGDSIACNPANDLPGGAGNTDCVPTHNSNPCGRYVSIPTSTDCDPGGVCNTLDDWRNLKQMQCANNGFCVTGPLGLDLAEQAVSYQPHPRGRVKLSWEDQNTAATIQIGGPNNGTWILPPPVYSDPPGPNSLRLEFASSLVGQIPVDIAIECTMGVDSQGPHGVYSAEPRSSPTPDNTAYYDNEVLFSTLLISPTGHLASSAGDEEVCLHVNSQATMLTPSPQCDVDNTSVPHSFQFRENASCSFDVDSTLQISIDPGGNFGLNPSAPIHFDGKLLEVSAPEAQDGESSLQDNGIVTGNARNDLTCPGDTEMWTLSVPEVHPCTALGVADAAAGFPIRHIFSCGAPTTVSISQDLDLANGVILDGEGLLTIEGGGLDDPTFILVDSGEVGEVRNMGLSGVQVSNQGQLTLDNVSMTASRAIRNHPGADLVVVNSSLTGNVASPEFVGGPEYGGALHNEGAATITDTTLSGNVAADFGGAVYSTGPGGLTIDDSLISTNSTSDLGGGIYVGSSASITNTTISGNMAAGEGGGVYVGTGGSVTITGGAIADNIAGNAGGGVFSKSALTIDGGAVVSGNQATTGRGGGLFQDSSVLLTMSDAEVRDNSSGDDGGGIVVEGSLLLERTVVQTNTAAGEGGGIQVGSAGDASVTDASAITQNVAGGSGGGVRVFRGILLVQDSTIDANQAGAVGGGVSSYGDSSGSATVTIERSTVSGNTSDSYGGGIEAQWWNNTLNIVESAIVGNTSTSAGGGGVYVHDGVVGLIRNSTIAQNASSVGGGGIRVTDAATDLRVIFCTFAENTTGTSGEAIALVSGTVTIQNSILKNTCNTPVTSYGGNLQADADTCGMSGTGDAVVLAFGLNLSSLGLNGGPTPNYLPLPGSFAIDHSAVNEGVYIDQRGVSRPQGASYDCGAVEALIP